MKWFFAALLLLVVALALESGLLAYSMYVLLGLLLVTRLFARSWTESLEAKRRIRVVGKTPDDELETTTGMTAEVGDRVSVRVLASNEGTLPIPWVLLEDVLPRYSVDPRFPRLRVRGKRLHIGMLWAGATTELRYQIECLTRGFYPIGPVIVETGDLFGLHRRYRVKTETKYLLVYPKIVPLEGYDLTSKRPIGDIRMSHRLYEDPTRIAGVRRYEAGDPLSRVHWRATARTGTLHCKIYEPSTLAGATILLDFHRASYPARGEPIRSELAVTTAASLTNALCEMSQQVGLITNGRNAAERIRQTSRVSDPRSRQEAQTLSDDAENDRLDPLVVPTHRGIEQLQRIREMLALVELNDGLTFAELVSEASARIPRDATVIAVLANVSVETALALGNLRRQGLAISVVLITLSTAALEKAHGRLLAEGVRDIRHLPDEANLPDLCRNSMMHNASYGSV